MASKKQLSEKQRVEKRLYRALVRISSIFEEYCIVCNTEEPEQDAYWSAHHRVYGYNEDVFNIHNTKGISVTYTNGEVGA